MTEGAGEGDGRATGVKPGESPGPAVPRRATLGDLLAELKRRHVFRVMIGYGLFSFAVLQVSEPVMHGAHLPDWVLTAVLVALALGFPVAVILAWVFDLTVHGVQRTPSTMGPGAPGAPSLRRARLLLPLAVAATVLAIAAAGAGSWYAWKRANEYSSPSTVPGAALSIAVLPFRDLSPNQDQEYFSDGMAEEILSALSKVKGLRVPGRVSSFYFKGKSVEPGEIAQKLGVAHLLEGSVRRSGNRLRISAEVIRARDGERLWSQSFDRELTDVLAVQDEIAKDVVEALRAKLMPGRPPAGKEYRPASRDAYESYLLGRHFSLSMSLDSQRRAIAAFQKAVEADPGYALAWAEMAFAHITVGTLDNGLWGEARRSALAAAKRSVELAPNLPDALAARAWARLQDWDWSGAKADADRAMELDPDSHNVIMAMAGYHGWMGQGPESVVLRRRIVEKEPLDGSAWNGLGFAYWAQGEFEQAERAFVRALEVDPQNSFAVRNWAGMLIDAGRPAEGLALCQSLERPDLVCMARAHHALGNAQESQRVLDAIIPNASLEGPFWIAWVYAFRGEADQAFEWLERAYAEHARQLNSLKGRGFLRSLHSDPRWASLLRKMNLPVD